MQTFQKKIFKKKTNKKYIFKNFCNLFKKLFKIINCKNKNKTKALLMI